MGNPQKAVSLSDVGRRRKNNEDTAAFFEPSDLAELQSNGSLYIVADGVGGAAKGERASQFAAQKLLHEYFQQPPGDPRERLCEIIRQINNDIHSYADENATRMATTLVAAVVRGGQLFVVNVGDTRAYLIRDGQAQQLTHDHSLVGEMVKHGELSEEEALHSRVKNRLTRSLGGEPDVQVEVYPPLPLKSGDRILLASDGLTRYTVREDIARLTLDGSTDEIARRLIQFANGCGGADNVSVVVAPYQGVEALAAAIKTRRPARVDEMDTFVTQTGGQARAHRGSWGLTLTLSLLALLLLGVGALVVARNWPVVGAMLGLTGSPVPASANQPADPVATGVAMTQTALGLDQSAPTADMPSSTLTPLPFQATIVLSTVRMHEGPDYEAREIPTDYHEGQILQVLSKNADASWFQVSSPQSDQTGWLVATWIKLNVDPAQIPVYQAQAQASESVPANDPAATGTATTPSRSTAHYLCAAQVAVGDSISAIYLSFGVHYEDYNDNGFYVCTAEADRLERCESKTPVDGKHTINPGQWLVVYGVDETGCTADGRGAWILDVADQ